MKATDVAKRIDHTLLKAEATHDEIIALCADAKKYHFAAVCVNPYWITVARHFLNNTDVKVCSVVGFPLGASSARMKTFETALAIENGADEIDMVINIGRLKESRIHLIIEEIARVRKVVRHPKILKVIIETAALTDDEIRFVSSACVESGADFVKTSTGFYNPPNGGAKVEHVKLIKDTIKNQASIKASGGIKTLDQLLELRAAGADRFGTSNGVPIYKEALERFG